jgi:hypothetical protein
VPEFNHFKMGFQAINNGLLRYAFFGRYKINQKFSLNFIPKTAKKKLPLHDFSIVKATAPSFFIPSPAPPDKPVKSNFWEQVFH